MFVCSIELLSYLKREEGEPIYLVVARFNFDLGFQKEDELWVNWEVSDKYYNLRAKVLERKKEVYAPHAKLIKFGKEAVEKGLFNLRILAEAEDRDAVLELSEAIERNEQLKRLQET